MKATKSKGNIASGYIYCPQEFLSVVTGKCYTFSCDAPILSQIEAILIQHRKPYSSFSLKDTQKALNHRGNFILVNCCDLTEDLKPITDYRWFYVAKDFEEAE